MTTIELSEAGAQFTEIVNRAGNGEQFTITRNGVPVARLAPPRTKGRRSVHEVIREMREARARRPAVSYEEIRESIEEGRA